MSGWTKVVTLSSSCSSPCVDPSSGSLIVATAQGDVVKIAKDGSAEVVARTQGQPLGVGFDAAGRMLICDAAHQTIFSLTDDGELSPIVSEYEEKAFRGPSSVAVDSAQTVYFTDSGHIGSTSLQNASGSVFAITGSSQVLQPLAFECLAHPCGVALAPPPPHDPTLAPVYVAEMMRNRVLRFVQSPKGVYHCSVFHQFAGGVGPSGVACDAAGHVFVARFEYHGLGCNGYVSVLDSEGKLLREIATPVPEVSGLAVSADQQLYISENSTMSIYRISVDEVFGAS